MSVDLESKVVSRRTFVKGALLVFTSGVLAGCDIGQRSETSAESTQQPVSPIRELVIPQELIIPQEDVVLKEGIEKQFNVELYNPAKAVLPYVESRYPFGFPIQWNGARLNTLRYSLSNLPEHFYQPNEQNRRLRLELTAGRFSKASEDEISLSFVQFDPSDPTEAFSCLTREFVYRVMPTTILPNGDISSPWFDRLEQVLGEDWMMISYKVGHDLNNRLYGGSVDKIVEKPLFPEEKKFYQRAYISMGVDPHAGFSSSPRNFIPNLSIDYVRGRRDFTLMYRQIFPADKVDQLYSFVNEDIFRGKEY